MNFLCDTNVISELMKPLANESVIDWLRKHQQFHISVITVEEIHCGLANRDARIQLHWFERFCDSHCVIYPVTKDVAIHSGMLRGQLRSKGEVRHQADLIIAATAILNDLIVATRNTKDFESCGVPLFNPFTDILSR